MPAVVQGGRYGYYRPGYGGWYGPWNAKEVDTGEFEEDPAKNSILLYDLDVDEDIEELEAEIQKICQCKIEHLPAIQSFILHYKNSAHLPASTFSSLPGIIFSNRSCNQMGPCHVYYMLVVPHSSVGERGGLSLYFPLELHYTFVSKI